MHTNLTGRFTRIGAPPVFWDVNILNSMWGFVFIFYPNFVASRPKEPLATMLPWSAGGGVWGHSDSFCISSCPFAEIGGRNKFFNSFSRGLSGKFFPRIFRKFPPLRCGMEGGQVDIWIWQLMTWCPAWTWRNDKTAYVKQHLWWTAYLVWFRHNRLKPTGKPFLELHGARLNCLGRGERNFERSGLSAVYLSWEPPNGDRSGTSDSVFMFLANLNSFLQIYSRDVIAVAKYRQWNFYSKARISESCNGYTGSS